MRIKKLLLFTVFLLGSGLSVLGMGFMNVDTQEQTAFRVMFLQNDGVGSYDPALIRFSDEYSFFGEHLQPLGRIVG